MSTRPDGRGYIDEQQSQSQLGQSTSTPPSPVASGSSISEQYSDPESENEPSQPDHPSAPPLASILDPRIRPHVDPEASDDSDSYRDEDEDEAEWDPEDEDWELAEGDFTKQYNRMRQLHAASNSNPSSNKTIAPATNQSRPPTSKPRAPGVAINPKSLADKQDKDKSDRATQDQVLDARTRLILSALTNRGVFGKMNKCISTGKEANVYHADPGPDSLYPVLAIKIYRTSILAFRARQSYMVGEHRFRGEYTSAKNPRKMVRVWAEKELRNLKRLEQGGVNAPRVVEVKQNVLVMEHLGIGDEASPRLKDAQLSHEDQTRLYAELWIMIRRMFKECRLVHADLSEYNLLYHNDHIYIIDVSQSVEEDHPRAFDFLRVDIHNMEEYFARQGIRTLGSRKVWDFVTGSNHAGTVEVINEWLDLPSDPIEDAVFMSSFIPRTLGQVYDPERDIDLVNAGRGDELIYADVTGLDTGMAAIEVEDVNKEQEVESDVGDVMSGASDEDEDEPTKTSRGFRHEDRDAKKERKKAVKDEKREKRKTKMPKSEKQRLLKKSAK